MFSMPAQPTPEDLSNLASEVSEAVTPAVQNLAGAAEPLLQAQAEADGWSTPQAGWIVKLAMQPLMQSVANGTPGPEALDAAYHAARRRLTISYFEDAITRGKRPFEAFLTVIDLEKQVAERAGRAAPAYPDALLKHACEVVEGASRRGDTAEAQVEIGYSILRGAPTPD